MVVAGISAPNPPRGLQQGETEHWGRGRGEIETDSRQKEQYERDTTGNSLVVQWLGLGALTARGPGWIPDRETKIPQTTQHSQKKRERERERGLE